MLPSDITPKSRKPGAWNIQAASIEWPIPECGCDKEAAVDVVETVTVTAAALLPAGIFAGEMLQVPGVGAPAQARVTWFANGPPVEVKAS